MANLIFNPEPTFPAKVGIPIAGSEPVEVVFIFKYRDKDEFDEFINTRTGKSDSESFMDMVTGWALEDKFTEDNVKLLLKKRIGTALAAYKVYVDELIGARVKN